MNLFGNTTLQLNSFNPPIIIRDQTDFIDIINGYSQGFESMVYLYLGLNFDYNEIINEKQIFQISNLYNWYNKSNTMAENGILKNYLYYYNGAQWMRIKVSDFDYENPVFETVTVKNYIAGVNVRGTRQEIPISNSDLFTGAISYGTGEVLDTYSGMQYVKVRVEGHRFIQFYSPTLKEDYSFGLAFYDNNENFISGYPFYKRLQTPSFYVVQTELIPENAVYAKLCYWGSRLQSTTHSPSLKIYFVDDYDSSIEEYFKLIIEKEKKQINGTEEKITNYSLINNSAINAFTGKSSENSYFCHTSFIPTTKMSIMDENIVQHQKFLRYISAKPDGEYSSGLAFYTAESEESFIEEAGQEFSIRTYLDHRYEIKTIAIPENAKYFRLTYWSKDRWDWTINSSTNLNYFIPPLQMWFVEDYDISAIGSLSQQVKELELNLYGTQVEIFDDNYYTPKTENIGGIDITTGQINQRAFRLISTNYIYTGGYKYLKFTAPKFRTINDPKNASMVGPYGLAFYDNKKVFLGTKYSVPYHYKKSFEDTFYEIRIVQIPENAKYFRLCYWEKGIVENRKLSETQIGNYNGIDTNYLPPLKMYLLQEDYNKSIEYFLTNKINDDNKNIFGTSVELSYNMIPGAINIKTGKINNSSGAISYYDSTNYINIEGYKYLRFFSPLMFHIYSYGISFYTNATEDSFILDSGIPNDIRTNSKEYYQIKTVKIPDEAKYVRCTYWNTDFINKQAINTTSCFLPAFQIWGVQDDYIGSLENKIETNINNISTNLYGTMVEIKDLNLTEGYIYYSPATNSIRITDEPNDYFEKTRLLGVQGYKYIKFIAPKTSKQYNYKIVFYQDDTGTIVDSILPVWQKLYPEEDFYEYRLVEIPENAKTVRLMYWNLSNRISKECPPLQVFLLQENYKNSLEYQTEKKIEKLESKIYGKRNQLTFNLYNGAIKVTEDETLTDGATTYTLYEGQVVGENSTGTVVYGYSTGESCKAWYSYTDFINIQNYSYFEYTAPCLNKIYNYGLIFYTEPNYLAVLKNTGIINPTREKDETYFKIKTVKIPTGAKYVRFTYWNTNIINTGKTPSNTTVIIPPPQAWGLGMNYENSTIKTLEDKINNLNSVISGTAEELNIGKLNPFTCIYKSGNNIGKTRKKSLSVSVIYYASTNFIDIRKYKYLKFYNIKTSVPVNYGYCFYSTKMEDTEGPRTDIIKTGTFGTRQDASDNYFELKTVKIPNDAKYVKFTYWIDNIVENQKFPFVQSFEATAHPLIKASESMASTIRTAIEENLSVNFVIAEINNFSSINVDNFPWLDENYKPSAGGETRNQLFKKTYFHIIGTNDNELYYYPSNLNEVTVDNMICGSGNINTLPFFKLWGIQDDYKESLEAKINNLYEESVDIANDLTWEDGKILINSSYSVKNIVIEDENGEDIIINDLTLNEGELENISTGARKYWITSNFFEIKDYSQVQYSRISTTFMAYPAAGIAFYNNEYNFISGQPVIMAASGKVADKKAILTTIDIPDNAVYARISYLKGSVINNGYNAPIYPEVYLIKNSSPQNANTGILYGDSSLINQAIELGLHDVPETQNQINIIKRARQLSDVKWTPAVDLPRMMMMRNNSTYYIGTFKAGTEYTGIPYARTKNSDNHATYINYISGGKSKNVSPIFPAQRYGYRSFYVNGAGESADDGGGISLGTFVTAIQNPNSFICNEYREQFNNVHYTIPYGTVCSKIASTAFNLSPMRETTNIVTKNPDLFNLHGSDYLDIESIAYSTYRFMLDTKYTTYNNIKFYFNISKFNRNEMTKIPYKTCNYSDPIFGSTNWSEEDIGTSYILNNSGTISGINLKVTAGDVIVLLPVTNPDPTNHPEYPSVLWCKIKKDQVYGHLRAYYYQDLKVFNQLKIGSLMNIYNVHSMILTDIIRDPTGNITHVEILDATPVGQYDTNDNGESKYGGVVRRTGWDVKDFVATYGNYQIYNYTNKKFVPYTPSPYVQVGAEPPWFSPRFLPIMPYEGNEFSYRFKPYAIFEQMESNEKFNPDKKYYIKDTEKDCYIQIAQKDFATIEQTANREGYLRLEEQPGGFIITSPLKTAMNYRNELVGDLIEEYNSKHKGIRLIVNNQNDNTIFRYQELSKSSSYFTTNHFTNYYCEIAKANKILSTSTYNDNDIYYKKVVYMQDSEVTADNFISKKNNLYSLNPSSRKFESVENFDSNIIYYTINDNGNIITYQKDKEVTADNFELKKDNLYNLNNENYFYVNSYGQYKLITSQDWSNMGGTATFYQKLYLKFTHIEINYESFDKTKKFNQKIELNPTTKQIIFFGTQPDIIDETVQYINPTWNINDQYVNAEQFNSIPGVYENIRPGKYQVRLTINKRNWPDFDKATSGDWHGTELCTFYINAPVTTIIKVEGENSLAGDVTITQEHGIDGTQKRTLSKLRKTKDIDIVDGKSYFTYQKDGTKETWLQVNAPNKNDINTYFERVPYQKLIYYPGETLLIKPSNSEKTITKIEQKINNLGHYYHDVNIEGFYTLTKDTVFDSTKTYYIKNAGTGAYVKAIDLTEFEENKEYYENSLDSTSNFVELETETPIVYNIPVMDNILKITL